MVVTRTKERGAALIEAAVTIPLILLICVAIFDLGRAYQTWQVITNAAREGARVSVIAGKTDDDVRAAVELFMKAGVNGDVLTRDGWTKDTHVDLARDVTVDTINMSQITVRYPFKFYVLGPVMKMVDRSSEQGNDVPLTAIAQMRNEN